MPPINRRQFNKATMATVGSLAAAQRLAAAQPSAGHRDPQTPHNIVLIVCDQESYHLQPAAGYTLPARQRLRELGTSFENHYIAAAMCTPSRGVIFSGQPPQINGVFDQMELGYVPSLDKQRPSLGTVMRDLGYTTAYYGKFELRKDIIHPRRHGQLQRGPRRVRL